MPELILGGKGSGRTHLMRYYSYALQRLRAPNHDILGYLRNQGYIGIFLRCEGLNAGRFAGKGQTDDVWSDVFAHYFDLWLAQLVIMTFADAIKSSPAEMETSTEVRIVTEVLACFDETITLSSYDITSLLNIFRDIRRNIDNNVNNAALKRDLGDLRIHSTRGRLVFSVPNIFVSNIKSAADLRVVYLIDELENLTELQQRYINTLIREKELPSTFKIGSRLYGFRTRKTLSAGEENRAGSEYSQILLDDELRTDTRYDAFAKHLIFQRLRFAGYVLPNSATAEQFLSDAFEQQENSLFEHKLTDFILRLYPDGNRPYLTRLRNQLSQRNANAIGIRSEGDLDEIVAAMRCDLFPLLEKANIFQLYRAWAGDENVLEAARRIAVGCESVVDGSGGARYDLLDHFKGDLIAQLLRDARQHQQYFGIDTFLKMSSGIPRHLLIVLKFIYRWAIFNGEKPFSGQTPITFNAQHAGVLEAANWFFEDARAVGMDVEHVHRSVQRLAIFLSDLRFSDKPVESSLSTFSYDSAAASARVNQTIRNAHSVSLLLQVIGGQKDRNDLGVIDKFQLNPMVCPRFNLPLERRGAVTLSKSEADAIFGDIPDDARNRILNVRLAGMNAPFLRGRRGRRQDQGLLPGLG